jgi:hypothetical protein
MPARDYLIEYYITSITKSVCEPHLCPEQSFNNREEVTHWSFTGDGQGDYENYGNRAGRPVVEAYIERCKEQAALAQEYLAKEGDSDA